MRMRKNDKNDNCVPINSENFMEFELIGFNYKYINIAEGVVRDHGTLKRNQPNLIFR